MSARAPRVRGWLLRLSAFVIGLVFAPLSAAASPIYAITVGAGSVQSLFSFDSTTPGTILPGGAIGGMQANERLVGIDFRPATGQLYGVGSTGRLYTIDLATLMATQVGSTFTLLGTAFGVDFNPTVDRLRITSDTGQNLRLNPNDATVLTDTNLAYAAGDVNAGATARIVGSAYTNSVSGAATTTLFDIDSNLDILTTQNPPNNGTLNTVGALGFNTSDLVGFDILTVGSVNTAFALLTPPTGGTGQFFTINLATGAATLVGTIGGSLPIADIAAAPQVPVPEPATLLLVGAGLFAAARRRRVR